MQSEPYELWYYLICFTCSEKFHVQLALYQLLLHIIAFPELLYFSGLMAIFHFSFQFPLYFLKIYNFELINYFRFRLPYTSSGNPFCLCKNIWAYSVEGTWKFNLFFVGKVGNCWGLALCKVLRNWCAWFFSTFFLIFDFGFFWAFSY